MTGKAACSKFAAYNLLPSKFRSVLLSSGLSIHLKKIKKLAAGVWLVLTFFSNENWSKQTFFQRELLRCAFCKPFTKISTKTANIIFKKV